VSPLELAGSGESPLESRGECKVHPDWVSRVAAVGLFLGLIISWRVTDISLEDAKIFHKGRAISVSKISLATDLVSICEDISDCHAGPRILS